MREIYDLQLQNSRPLVTLSACNVGISEVNPGDELEGMTRAFLFTGARGVVASLWAVDDNAAPDFMTRFYIHRASGMTNAQALATTKREFTNLSPYYWAGFVLIGN